MYYIIFSTDLPFLSYLASVIRNTSRTERIACAVSIVILIVFISLIVYFTTASSNNTVATDVAPHEWNITREMWIAMEYNNSKIENKFEPIRLVIINHSGSPECHTFRICAAELRNIQGYYIKKIGYDIPYNFIIGNDGRVYEGRGWKMEGAHTKFFNKCSLGLGFIGDYRATSNTHTEVTEAQIQRTHMLLEDGVRRGLLHPEYVIVGYKDLRGGESPGSNLYNVMKQWRHYNNEIYRDMNCEQIYQY